MRIEPRIEAHLGQLVGARCWSVIGDEHADVHLGFGEKVSRDKPLANSALTKEEQYWRPALDILVHCSWRLQSKDTVLAANSDGGAALKLLVGRTLDGVDTQPPGWDLVLHFADDLDLVVFADETRAGYDNFSVKANDSFLVVHAKSLVTWE
jgi:hypothetical protein